MEPMHLGHVTLGDGDEARETRFRSEQVIERSVHARRAHRVAKPVADREQAPPVVVEEAEVHLVEVRAGARREAVEARGYRGVAALSDLPQSGGQRQERGSKMAAVNG